MPKIFSTKAKAILCRIKRRTSPLSFTAFLSFVTLMLFTYFAISPIDGEKELYSNVIRFHVLANSDTEADQSLKLLVRDRVTEYTTKILADATDVDSAGKLISENAEEILRISKECITENGYNYPVSIEIGKEIYPRRDYERFIFPAGVYNSVRLKIGKAEGKNWWCVLFPPLCRAGATVEKYENDSELLKIGFNEDEISLISDTKNTRTEVRLFFLDLIYKKR